MCTHVKTQQILTLRHVYFIIFVLLLKKRLKILFNFLKNSMRASEKCKIYILQLKKQRINYFVQGEKTRKWLNHSKIPFWALPIMPHCFSTPLPLSCPFMRAPVTSSTLQSHSESNLFTKTPFKKIVEHNHHTFPHIFPLQFPLLGSLSGSSYFIYCPFSILAYIHRGENIE